MLTVSTSLMSVSSIKTMVSSGRFEIIFFNSLIDIDFYSLSCYNV